RSLAFRAGWFLRSRPILVRRWIQQLLADWRPAAAAVKACEHWNPAGFRATLSDLFWTRPRVIREYLHEMASGDPRCDWVTWMMHRYAVGQNLSVMVLGCGDGWMELALAARPRVARITGVDLSREALRRADESARAAGYAEKIRHAPVDLDREALPGGPY